MVTTRTRHARRTTPETATSRTRQHPADPRRTGAAKLRDRARHTQAGYRKLDKLSLSQIQELYNMRAPEARRFRSKVEGREALTALLVSLGLEIGADEEGQPVVRRRGRGGPAPAHADEAIVRLQTRENPKRPGTAAHERFGLYTDGMTVGAYLDACAVLQGGARAVYRNDLRWDETRGYIKIVATK